MRLLVCGVPIRVAREVARRALVRGFVTDCVADVFEACRRLEQEGYDALLLGPVDSEGELRNAMRVIRALGMEVAVGVMEGPTRLMGRDLLDLGMDCPAVVRNLEKDLKEFLANTAQGTWRESRGKVAHSEGGTLERRIRDASAMAHL